MYDYIYLVPLNLLWSSSHRKDVGPWITTFVLPGEIILGLCVGLYMHKSHATLTS